ncbi:MAG: sigma-70 family RNA polymerase sigma factor [Eubacteriales bacterium]|nr:sigma-70 family RNA polymerase sigma factor [Eubacteriales bacterium]
MTNEEIITAIRTEGDPDRHLLMDLWNQNAGLIRKACGKMQGYLEPEDARQECFIPFSEAVDAYDPGAGQSFASFLYSRLSWHLIRYVQDSGASIRIPIYQRDTIRKYRKYVTSYYQITGKEPEDRTICAVLDLSPEQLQQLRKDQCCINPKSLDAPLSAGEDDAVCLSDIIPDTGADIEEPTTEAIFRQQRRRAVWDAVDSLEAAQEREAVRLYYREGMTYQQAAEVMGVSAQRVRAVIAQAFRKLRTRKKYRVLREFVDLSPLYSMGIRGGIGSFNRTWTSSTENAALKDLERQREMLIHSILLP